MISEKLKQHISHSQAAAAANKAKGNRHIEILSSLYSDASHFIEELMQNADDACLKKKETINNAYCCFKLNQNSLSFSHNGREFDENDIISITTIGQSTKKNSPDINITGKFGLGFKSIFAICDEPEIYSGQFNFKIIDFEVPQFLENNNANSSETSFIFPLKDNIITSSIVEKGLKNISHRHLLFTKCISSIHVALPQTSFILAKKTIKILDKHLSIIQITNTLHQDTPLLFLLFEIPLPDNKWVQSAFLISDLNNIEFVNVENEPAFVVFPTLFHTGLQFAINAPFTTTPTREQIPFDEEKTPENFQILQHIQKGFSGLLQLLKKHKLLNISFFGIVPFDLEKHKNNPLAHAIANGLIEESNTKAVWPSPTMKFYSASQILVCSSQIQQLLSHTDVKLLFHRETVLHHDVAKAIPKHLHTKKPFSLFKFADEKDFAFAISSRLDFLKKKNAKWHSSFLTFVSKHPDLWNKTKQDSWFSLRKKQFVLLNDLSIACPFEENEAVVFLYDKSKRNTPMVHRELMANSEIADFFQQLGLPDPDEMYEFRKLINHIHSTSPTTSSKLSSFWLKILKLYAESSESIQMQMIERLKTLKIIPATDTTSGKFTIACAEDVYFKTKEVETFLKDTNHLTINIQSLEALKKNGFSAEFSEDIFTKLGVGHLPALKSFDNPSRISEFEIHRKEIEHKGLIVVKESVTDFDLHGLDDFFKYPSLEKSRVLALLLSKTNKQAIYKIQTYTQDFTFTLAANYEITLHANPWLYNSFGCLIAKNEISTIHKQYFTKDIQIEKICQLAGIQLQSTDFSSSETELILKLREFKTTPQLQEQFIKEFVEKSNSDIHEELTTEPLVVDYLSFDGNTIPQETLNKATSIAVPNTIPFPETSYNKFFSEHPLRQRAEQIALDVLIKKFGKQNIQQHQSMQAGLMELVFNNEKILVFISGISQIPGLFVFPHYPEIITEAKYMCVAVDNIGKGTPVVYLRMVDKTRHETTPYFLMPM